ncbi:32325_t:CDS:2, partial [Racocetra persica]
DNQESTNKEDENDENNEDDSDRDIDDSNNNTEDSISELFSRVFVNDSLFCASKIEKPYYSAKIYSNICINCRCLEVSKPER